MTQPRSAAAEMEGFARPLWGLAPLAAGQGAFEGLELFLRGLANGTDPAHAEYWGDVEDRDQRMVEMGALAFALLLSPETFWEPLDTRAKARAAEWLGSVNRREPHDNNWLFFRVLTNLALRHVGEDWSEEAVLQALDRLDEFHLGGGYYRDGTDHQIDYYAPMVMHFYALLLARFAPAHLVGRTGRYRERARLFARDFQHWFADDGAAIPFGRSMTYRFAQGAFWAVCAFAGEEVLPWGRMKGLLLRHLRWWSNQPIADRDGVLSIGYAYPTLLVCETYNSPASPYWALKAFLVAALADDHPFWTAQEEPACELPDGPVLSPAAGFAVRRQAGDTVMLTGGQDGGAHRGCDAKYARFAYSSAFGFCVASESWPPLHAGRGAVDCGLMVSRDGRSWQSRGRIRESGMEDGFAWGRWRPDERLSIETWLCFAQPGWHVRVHRIETDAALCVAESGFAVDATGEKPALCPSSSKGLPSGGFVRTLSAVSGIHDLNGEREADLVRAAPNTNLLVPRAVFPRLTGRVPVGVSVIATAVFARPDPDATVEGFELPLVARMLVVRLKGPVSRSP